MAGFWRKLFDPRVSSHLIADEGEIVIDEVRRHPMAFVLPVLIMLLGLLIMISTLWFPVQVAVLPLAAGLVVIGIGAYRMLSAHMDRFVITNMRVFRVRGIFSQHTATMPMSRILDISVHKPLIGRIFSYGHFVFESAAQDQGLRDIRFVARPDERDLTIQRVIQRSGLRSSMRPLGEREDASEVLLDDVSEVPGSAEDPTGGSRRPTPEEDAAWLSEGRPQDPPGGRHRTAAWSARDQAEHERARRQVAGSELGGRPFGVRLPVIRQTFVEGGPPEDGRDEDPYGRDENGEAQDPGGKEPGSGRS